MWLKSSFTIPGLVAISLCLFIATGPVAADIINVPDDAPTIQAGIDLALDGDEVVVAEGMYVENINFNGKAITVRSVDPGDPFVVEATIIDAAGSGRVVTCASGEGPDTVLSGFTITGGSATNGAGMQNSGGSSPTVSNCTFIDNAATNNGGGMRNNNGSPTVINCTFIDNAAGNAGGGMQNGNNSSPTVTNCTFSGNVADFGGGMYNTNSNPTVTNCTFSGNVADFGGGMYNSNGSNPTVTNCTFSGNVAIVDGGGMYNSGSSPTVTNCILWGDSPGEIFNSNSTPVVTYSDVQGGYAGLGNIDVDPLFIDPDGADDDLRLNRYSPCTDAANNDASGLSGITTDLDGEPRFVDDAGVADTGVGPAPIVDMGAYERQTDSVPIIIKITIADSIQETIDAAFDGDEIVLNLGTYNQAINLMGKAITIRSTDPDDPAVVAATILDGTGLGTTIITCGSGESANTVITGLTITNANVSGNGGGMRNFAGSSPTVTNCTFSGNSANFGGGMQNGNNSSPTVTNCTFSGNSATNFGGGMQNDNNSSPTVTNCTFTGNSAGTGGGMYNTGSSPTVTNCTFSGNVAGNFGGGMLNNNGSNPTVTNCTFTANMAEQNGGGMHNGFSSPTVTNCTFTANAAQFGGGMGNIVGSSPTVTNCILWGDSPDEIFNDASTPIVTYSNVQGGYAGAGNIDVDPLFIDPDGADDNLRLDRYSLCTDAADNTAPDLVGITQDLDGNPRFVDDAGIADTGVGPAPIVDMGAYERQTDSVPISIKITPADSIQAVIDDPETLDGDEIVLNMGTYNQAINLMGKAITIRSTDPSDPAVVAATILDGTGLGTTIIICNSGETAATVISGLTITNGDVSGNGGGMRNTGSSPTVTNCTFSGNVADSGGGMANINSSPTVTNCTFSGNMASSAGGGMRNFQSSPTVTNCTFSGNVSDFLCGGMYNVFNSSPTVTNCTFSGNTATFEGGGMLNNNNTSPTVTNCTFSGNSAVSGGGMFNTINSSPTVTNCILWGDSPDEIFDFESTPIVTYSDVQGGYAGAGNIDADPGFVDPDGEDDMVGTVDDNLRPTAAAVIDTGDNASIPPDTADLDGDGDTAEPTPFDLDGNPRVVDGNLDTIATVDMGAYEPDFDSVSVVFNLTQSTTHGSIAEAIAAAIGGDELLASIFTFANEPDIDFNNKALTLRSNGPIEQEGGGLYTMADDASLESATGTDMTLNGELRVNNGDAADVAANALIANAGSELIARTGAGLYITTDAGVTLDGDATLLPGATMGFGGGVTIGGSLTAISGATVDVSGAFASTGTVSLLNGVSLLSDLVSNSGLMQMSAVTVLADGVANEGAGEIVVSGDIFSDVLNDGSVICIEDTLVVGDYTNNGITIVQIGTLTIIGTLINNGTIIGDVQTPPSPAGGGGTQPGDGLAIAGDYIAGPDAALIMPDPVWRFSLGGHYDVAITDNANYHMIDAELRMAGGIGTQNLELMSLDIGADSEGLDPSFPGHYPIGTLRIGPGPVIVNLVDAHDNDGQGQTMCEAIYVQQLIIEPGATLNTFGCLVYYVNLKNDGTVDDPANLIPLPPACPADLDADGSVGATDLLSLLVTWGPCDDCNDCPADLDGNCTVGATDLLALLVNWGPCP